MGEVILTKYGESSKPDLKNAVVTLASGTLTYDGTTKTQAVASVVMNGQTLVENTDYTVINNSYTNAGTYVLSVRGMRNYKGNKNVLWTIEKAQSTISVNPSNIKIIGTNETSTATVTYMGDGSLSVSSSDSEVATASISGTTITVTSTGFGNATVTINLNAGINYTGISTTISIKVVIANIYGASWDGTSNTAWTRTDDSALFTDPVPYISGATNYGSPFDNLMPWSGMQIVEDAEAGTMVSIPKFWYKLTPNGSTDSAGFKIQIADNAVDGFNVSPAHMDRGDGKGERDVIYIGRYHAANASTKKSVTGQKPWVNITRSTARTQLHALGSTIWQADWAMRFTIWLLYIVEFADWNSQEKIGYGGSQTGSSEGTAFNMGYTDSMPYHTGTTASSRTAPYSGTQYRNIEGLWDNVYDWIDGCYNNSSGLNLILNPSKFSDSGNGISVGTPSSGYPSIFSIKDVNGTFPLFIPSAVGGSDSTYSCDGWIFDVGYPCINAGGYYSHGDGLFYYYCRASGHYDGATGSRSMKLP